MADKEMKAVQESTEKQKPAKEKAKKPNALVRGWKRVARYFREMKSELKKVVWPSGKQVVRNTIVVIAVVIVVGVLIWIFDWIASAVVKALVNLAQG